VLLTLPLTIWVDSADVDALCLVADNTRHDYGNRPQTLEMNPHSFVVVLYPVLGPLLRKHVEVKFEFSFEAA
jgi:hypothetical protein